MKKTVQDKEYECGFDLTDIGAPTFFKLLQRNKLIFTQRKKDSGAYVWGFAEGYIVTGCDPLTGNYMRPEARDPEIGYASYIGIKGTKAFRDRVVRFILKHAKHVKGFDPNERSYI